MNQFLFPTVPLGVPITPEGIVMKEILYRHCRLRREHENGCTIVYSYIPEPYCQVGKSLKLRDDDGNWEDGWKVLVAGDQRSFAEVETQGNAHRGIRKAGGDTGKD